MAKLMRSSAPVTVNTLRLVPSRASNEGSRRFHSHGEGTYYNFLLRHYHYSDIKIKCWHKYHNQHASLRIYAKLPVPYDLCISGSNFMSTYSGLTPV